MASVITVFSGKGGAGKSFVASNLACGFSMLERKTLLVDFSFGIRNDDAILGLTDAVLYNVGDVLSGECKLEEAIIRSDKDYIPDFLGSSLNKPDDDLLKSVRKILKSISKEYDFVVFDCTNPAGVEFDVCCSVSGTVLAVCSDDCFSVGNTALCIMRLKNQLPERKYLIINKVSVSSDEEDVCAEEIIEDTGLRLMGIVPEDNYAFLSMRNGDPLIRYDTPAGVELENVCRRLLGERIPYIPYKKSKSIFDKNKLTLKNKQGGY